jgi:hypothetical protein
MNSAYGNRPGNPTCVARVAPRRSGYLATLVWLATRASLKATREIGNRSESRSWQPRIRARQVRRCPNQSPRELPGTTTSIRPRSTNGTPAQISSARTRRLTAARSRGASPPAGRCVLRRTQPGLATHHSGSANTQIELLLAMGTGISGVMTVITDGADSPDPTTIATYCLPFTL